MSESLLKDIGASVINEVVRLSPGARSALNAPPGTWKREWQDQGSEALIREALDLDTSDLREIAENLDHPYDNVVGIITSALGIG